jgi:hypothetical protein
MPQLQLGLPGSRMKVLISGQKRQVVTDAQLCEQGINGSNLYTLSAASIPQCGRVNVIAAIRNQQWQSSEPLDNVRLRFRTVEALQELLQYQAGSDDLCS